MTRVRHREGIRQWADVHVVAKGAVHGTSRVSPRHDARRLEHDGQVIVLEENIQIDLEDWDGNTAYATYE